jgi:hypothetical protein
MSDIHQITWGDIARLGVDEQNRLYWDNKLIVTKQAIVLDWMVTTAAVITGVSTLALAVVSVFQLLGCH